MFELMPYAARRMMVNPFAEMERDFWNGPMGEIKTDITDIAAGSGYAAGGQQSAQVSSAQTGGVYKLVLTDVVFTASGVIGPFRYVVLYNNTATNKELIGWWDYGSSITLASGETFTVDFDATNGALTIG